MVWIGHEDRVEAWPVGRVVVGGAGGALVQLTTLRHAIVVQQHLPVGNQTASALYRDHVGRH